MTFRCAGIVQESFVDGPGIRLAVFVQGCSHHCKGCHNQHTWDSFGGFVTGTDYILHEYRSNPLLSGITLTGGEPMEQPKAMLVLAREVHALGGNVWCYTGYTLEELRAKKDSAINNLLKEIDVLVDGPFILDLRDLNLQWRGSSNQRIIDLRKESDEDGH